MVFLPVAFFLSLYHHPISKKNIHFKDFVWVLWISSLCLILSAFILLCQKNVNNMMITQVWTVQLNWYGMVGGWCQRKLIRLKSNVKHIFYHNKGKYNLHHECLQEEVIKGLWKWLHRCFFYSFDAVALLFKNSYDILKLFRCYWYILDYV